MAERVTPAESGAARDALVRHEGIRHGRIQERRNLGKAGLFVGAFFAALGIAVYLLAGRIDALIWSMGGCGANLGNALYLLVIEPVPTHCARADRQGRTL